ncbi:hypothetical protein LguiA_027324 [Lonicera macranthoides]
MESTGAISGEWSSFSGMYSKEEADFVGQMFDNCSLPNELSWGSFFDVPTLLPGHELFDNNSMYSLDNANINQILSTNNCSTLMDYYLGGGTSSPIKVLTNSLVGVGDLQPEAFITEPEMLVPEPDQSVEEKPNNPLERLKKRSHNLGHVPNNKLRKNQRIVSTLSNDEDDNARLHKQRLSNFCSEDESYGSKELNALNTSSKSNGGVALNSNGKKRASRGSATDPQSLYARRRRERINERLRVLQNLVPNGTKVDISTMLEEAVAYVKFLQLQIKLLSSDDLWMYAPIAYNGMEIGLDLKITSPK